MDELHLFTICEDVRIEIFKYLNKQDMGNLSLTCKYGYEITKDFFETKTQLNFSRPLNLPEIQMALKCNRNHKNVGVQFEVKLDDDIILSQLAYVDITPTILKYYGYNTEEVLRSVGTIKAKHNENVRIEYGDIVIKSEKDVDECYIDPFAPHLITSLKVCLDSSDPFDVRLFHRLIDEFPNLEAMTVDGNWYGDYWPELIPDINKNFENLKTLALSNEMLFRLIPSSLFDKLNMIELTYCTDLSLLQTLLNNNKTTLKTLKVNWYNATNTSINVPCQLNTLKITTGCEKFTESIIHNQNELQFLELSVPFTPTLLEMLESHGSINLNVKGSSYVLMSGFPLQYTKAKLAKVKYLTTDYSDFIKYITKSVNLETLRIVCDFYDNEKSNIFHTINGVELKNLKQLNIEDLENGLLENFASINLRLPALEELNCNFNLKLFKAYPKLKSLTVCVSSIENLKIIVEFFKKLEKLEVKVNTDILADTMIFFGKEEFSNNLQLVKITAFASTFTQFEVLRKLESKSFEVKHFSNFESDDDLYCNYMSITVEIDMPNRNCMYTLVKQ